MSIADPFDLAGKVARKEQSARDAVARSTQERDDWIALMRTEWGRRLFRRLCTDFGEDQPVFNSNNSVMSRLAGMRDWVAAKRVYLRRVCPELLAQSTVEHDTDRESRSAE